ncbi:MAG: tRNA dihydrouridine synthase, partial [Thermoguttaceae bacterium]
DIVQKVVAAAAPVPVTAKIRIGRTRDSITGIDVAQAVEAAGAAWITVHGRTASEMYSGNADWNVIAEIKKHLKRLPLIGNGDIRSVETAISHIKSGEVDGIMIGRAALNRPWIFHQIKQALRGEAVDAEPSPSMIREMLKKHFERLEEQFSENVVLALMKKLTCHFTAGRSGARKFRDALSCLTNRDELVRQLSIFFVD